MITINYEDKRILKALFNMRGEVNICRGANGVSIVYSYKDTELIIYKSLDNRFYVEEEESLVCFTTPSSLINYLKNNFQ